jgi:uncharacterized membrane protein
MFKKIIDTLKHQRRASNVLALLLISGTSLVLIAIRFYFAMPSRAYVFLVWNLFLAWIPYLIGLLLLLYRQQIKAAWQLWIVVGGWLLFFPNAPYIATDFFHFGQKPYIPVWFDLIMLFSFAWSGLLLTLLSLRDVHTVIAQRYGCGWGRLFAAGAIGFGALGVYTGRYLRWNSWDVFIDPAELLSDVTHRLIYPSQDWRAWGLTLAFSFFLGSAYTTLLLLTEDPSAAKGK